MREAPDPQLFGSKETDNRRPFLGRDRATKARHPGRVPLASDLLAMPHWHRDRIGNGPDNPAQDKIRRKKQGFSLFHKVKHASHKVMLLSNSCYAFFFEIMLLSVPRFTRISGMWYLVAFGEIHLFTG